MTDTGRRIDAAINKYVEHFNLGIPVGFAEVELENPDDPDEWEKVLGEAIEFDEPFDFCCEGVFTDEEAASEDRLRSERKARIEEKRKQKHKQ